MAFAKKDSEATCGVCVAMAANGHLERLKQEAIHDRWPGANQKGDPKMTTMQVAFSRHPMVTTNPVRAAIEVGYSETYAKKHAHALRKQLSRAIMAHQEEAQRRSAISAARIQQELAALGFANVIDYYNVDPETGHVTPKQLNELTREQAAAIQEVEMMEIDTLEGPKIVVGKIKLADKRANLVELGKTIGMFNKFTIEDRRQNTLDLAEVPTEDLEKVEQYLLNKAREASDRKKRGEAVDAEYTEGTRSGPQLLDAPTSKESE